jgi:superfamily II DNA helicase RecQ
MQFKIFTVPVSDDGAAIEEMNSFLRGHKALEVEQQLISTKAGSHWHFCIKYLANALPVMTAGRPQGVSKVDYKEVLSEKVFAVFSALREARKRVAEEDGLPVYAVFTNEELAGIAALESVAVEGMKKVKGVGDKKVERFGKRLAEYYAKAQEGHVKAPEGGSKAQEGGSKAQEGGSGEA